VSDQRDIMASYGALEQSESTSNWTIWCSIGVGYYLSYRTIPDMYDHVKTKMWSTVLTVEIMRMHNANNN
jgi:hypothetical protein